MCRRELTGTGADARAPLVSSALPTLLDELPFEIVRYMALEACW